MSGVARQTGAEPCLDQALRGVFQIRREGEAQGWCVGRAAPPAAPSPRR